MQDVINVRFKVGPSNVKVQLQSQQRERPQWCWKCSAAPIRLVLPLAPIPAPGLAS